MRNVLLFVLVFNLWPAAVFGEADGPDHWKVVGIKQDRFLNVRRGPSTKFSIVGKIPFDTAGLENLGCFPEFTSDEWIQFNATDQSAAIDIRWCRVNYLNIAGWVHGSYLAED